MDFKLIIATASVLIAALALFVAMSSRRISRKSLALSELQEARRAARLDVRHARALSWRDGTTGDRWIVVEILAVNPTDRDGAIITADLHITYTRVSDRPTVIKISHDAQAAVPGTGDPLMIPVQLPANGGTAGWLCFKVPADLLADATVNQFDVVVQDSRGPSATISPWALQEI